MNTHRVITSVGIVCFLLSGCSSSQNQKTEAEARIGIIDFLRPGCSTTKVQISEAEARVGIEEGFKKLFEETGIAKHLAEDHSLSNSSEVETWIFIGTNTPYKAETIQEKSTPIWIEDIPNKIMQNQRVDPTREGAQSNVPDA